MKFVQFEIKLRIEVEKNQTIDAVLEIVRAMKMAALQAGAREAIATALDEAIA